MIITDKAEITGIFGPVASGKTHLIRSDIQRQNRYIVFDHAGEFSDGEKVECFFANPKGALERLRQNPYFFRLSYTPGLDIQTDFKWILSSLWHLPVSKVLVCDEVHAIAPVSGLEKHVEMLLRFARHAHLGFVGASQRIADVSKLFTSCCRAVVLFKTDEARDLQAIEDRWRCADMVEQLRPLKYDDNAQVTIQTPQAVLCRRGSKPEVIEL